MSKRNEVDIIQFRNEDGDYVYTKSHVDGLDGFEKYYQEQLDTADSLASFQANHIQDSGWMDYDVLPTSDKNAMYSSSGFKCGIRQIHYVYGNAATGQRYVTQKMIKVNIRKFKHNEQIAQLPSGFMKNTQVFWARGGNGYQPIMVQVMNDGKIIPRLMVQDVNNADNDNWIYAQFEWTE